MTSPVSNAPAITQADVLNPIVVAQLGHMAQSAGLSQDDTAAILGLMQETAFNAARDAAVRASMAMLPRVLAIIRDVHQGSALRVADRITQVNQGVQRGMLSNHVNCVAAAHAVANEPAQRRAAGR